MNSSADLQMAYRRGRHGDARPRRRRDPSSSEVRFKKTSSSSKSELIAESELKTERERKSRKLAPRTAADPHSKSTLGHNSDSPATIYHFFVHSQDLPAYLEGVILLRSSGDAVPGQ
ncbi:hypothetical protein EVAR_96694_1 [Eumeta japonica]|uniref:Uncharacterized protein n=1 Tax=Eumeta variegata TaxID=151549 RepID=A0A4C1WGE1_EUMVA|nr:hypothetical protein EVAR_96694_1 [Eumeta japonica]